jgi:hypothetical protein
MTIKRTQYTYELVGKVNEKKTHQAKKGTKYEGTHYYSLLITCENKPQVKKIFVFKDKLEKEQIWKDIEEAQYIRKEFVFFCKNYMGNYRLID